MNPVRVFASNAFMQASAGEPIRSVIVESAESVIVAWHVEPGQRIEPHVHPEGQDTWTILSGKGLYQFDATGTTQPIAEGDVVIAYKGCVHGVLNHGNVPLRFISVVSPANAGYEPA